MEKLLREYYEIRGLDGDGKPKKEVLIKAGLEDLAKSYMDQIDPSSNHQNGEGKYHNQIHALLGGRRYIDGFIISKRGMGRRV